MADAPDSASPGGLPHPQLIGRYRILGKIGRGSMGVVFAAVDEQLDRRVAVKLMLGNFDQEPEMRERFYREAKITGQLAHRNIVTVLDLGDDDGRPYIVMELLEGLPLTDFLGTPAAQTVDSKLDLMMQVCEGLQNAHKTGVIHRDIKPSNLFVQHDGTLKILDFGVARLSTSSLTASGFLVGTPEYMSPEQTQGRRVDARSDVFSAAAVFYYMLTRRSPFGSRDLRQMLQAIALDDPPPLTENDAPESVRRVIMKGLTKDPEARYQHSADMFADLERARRNLHAATYLVLQGALDRYRQTLKTIEERRTLGRSRGVAGIDAACDEAVARLQARFPTFAAQARDASLMEPVDRAVAQAALEALQVRHNAELAALAAMRDGAAFATSASRNRTSTPSSGPVGESWRAKATRFLRSFSGSDT